MAIICARFACGLGNKLCEAITAAGYDVDLLYSQGWLQTWHNGTINYLYRGNLVLYEQCKGKRVNVVVIGQGSGYVVYDKQHEIDEWDYKTDLMPTKPTMLNDCYLQAASSHLAAATQALRALDNHANDTKHAQVAVDVAMVYHELHIALNNLYKFMDNYVDVDPTLAKRARGIADKYHAKRFASHDDQLITE